MFDIGAREKRRNTKCECRQPRCNTASHGGRTVFVLAAFLLASDASANAAKPIDFSQDIRPILSDKCFACHGPQDESREGGFRLDVKESAFGEADSGQRPIVPGSPGESELIARITSEDEDLRMPPADTNKKLTPQEIETIRRWIEAGAPWQEHWSLITPKRPPVPQVRDEAWPRNPVDNFILARLEKEQLTPSAEADKVTLIRRVTFDLTGLPPTLEEVDAFLRDGSAAAYENVVDRLLRSTRYGEHMARFWLDAARYGDTHGLHLDNYREIWPYRDWVIKAFNANMPYDQFTIEQLAGDLLPDATLDQQVATGFIRCNVTTNEGGSIAEEVYVRNVVDRVVTFGTVFMGMTFECSRCHDHKFDPFTMNDFYSLFAFFNSIDGNPMDGNRKDHAPVVRVPSEQQQQQLDRYDQQIAALESRLRDPWPQVDRQQAQWEDDLAKAAAAPGGHDPQALNVKLGLLALGDWFTVGPFNDNRRYLNSRQHGPEGKPVDLEQEFELATGERATWVCRADWADGTPHQDLPGETAANFLYRGIFSPKDQKVTVSLGSDDGIKVYLNEKQLLDKDVSRGVAADQETLELPLKSGENHLLIKIMNYGGASGFYFALKSQQSAVSEEILGLVRLARQDRTEQQAKKLRDHFRNSVANSDEIKGVRSELKRLRAARADVDRGIPTTLVWRERKEPRPAFFLERGEYDRRRDEVVRRTPAALVPMDDLLPMDRLGLAKWLVNPNHPLTARVAVNRFWQQLFGTGLVKTSEDFGSQGQPPSHPELLDWLAVQFIDDGWDVKTMMKRLVMSATYRQSSRVTPQRMLRDPANRLLARGPRFRLDAEMLRDQALFVSGLLVEKLGGPSVKPPQPDGLWFAVGYSGSNTVRFVADQGHDNVHRRTLYTFIKRTAPPPQMSTFDGPSRESCTVRRERTNTPLQALLLFNDPQYVEAARALAERTMKEGGDSVSSRAAYMFRICTGRHPDQDELTDLVQSFHEDFETYSNDEEAAKQVVTVGEFSADGSSRASELAAWTVTANLILNLDEVVTKN